MLTIKDFMVEDYRDGWDIGQEIKSLIPVDIQELALELKTKRLRDSDAVLTFRNPGKAELLAILFALRLTYENNAPPS